MKRLSAKVDEESRGKLDEILRETPLGERGAARFVRYLENVNSPTATLSQMASAPHCAKLLLQIVATSQQLSDLIVQNPELADVVLSPDVLSSPVTVESLVSEGERLLNHATVYSHKLDRVRFLKQKSILQTAALDLGDLLDQELIWARLSDLAEAVLLLIRKVVWEQVGGEGVCPVSILGMGKFGGRELNFSSDIDLVFVVGDGIEEGDEKQIRKFAELFRSALADRMGRGDLYRVDLRLRPFGSQGPIFSRMKTLESYYDTYAEAWEHQAMIRSVVLGDDPEIAERWADLRDRVAFKPNRGTWVLDTMEAMRRKIEEHSDDDDLKRGPGGIRDIEFQVQALQLIHGGSHESLRGRGTLETLRELQQLELVPAEAASDLDESYQFLRKLEHRCQIISGLQTHKIPDDADGRETVARAMGFQTVHALQSSLEHHRVRTRRWYEKAFLKAGRAPVMDSDELAAWFDGLPGGTQFAESLRKNASSLARVTKVVAEAPALIPVLRSSVALTEQVMTGEIEEVSIAEERFERLGSNAEPAELAEVAKTGWSAALIRWLLVPGQDLGRLLADHEDAFVRRSFEPIEGVIGAVALGSFGARDSTAASDADVIVFVDDASDRVTVERKLKQQVNLLSSARSSGSPVAIDFRLRPEGQLGRLGVTPATFRRYEETSMETWERFALARTRLIFGDPAVEAMVNRAAFHSPLDDQALKELLKMKSRIENERVSPKIRNRHIKLGNGGMDDVIWLVQLWFMRHPWLAKENPSAKTTDRVSALVEAKILTVIEGDELKRAWAFLFELRTRLFLFGVADDVLPENPDRLDKLSRVMDCGDANGLLKKFGQVTGSVRGLYEDGIRRMQA